MSKRPLLRISTAGSVDDGKSTLIGRLMHDCHAIMEDQLLQIKSKHDPDEVDLAAFTDGLKSEREQGITIDVAYKYFSTPNRKYILADTPGHEQYTRNMATGASTADAAIILIDCIQGLTTQTSRHTKISALLGIPHIIFAVNKIDRCDYDETVFRNIEEEIRSLAGQVGIKEWLTIPVSALKGDQVTKRSERLSWFDGPSLLEVLEGLETANSGEGEGRFSVQYVIRPDQNFRGFAGKMVQGTLTKGEPIIVYPSNVKTKIKDLYRGGKPVDIGKKGHSLVVELDAEVDCERGSIIVPESNGLLHATDWKVDLVWFAGEESRSQQRYLLKSREQLVSVTLERIESKINFHNLQSELATSLELNDIGEARITTHHPLMADPYNRSRLSGSFILIDPATNGTVAAGFLRTAESNDKASAQKIIWHYSQDRQYLRKIHNQNRHHSLLVVGSTAQDKETNLWWLTHLARSQVTLLTDRQDFLEFAHPQIRWSVSDSTSSEKEPPYETGL